MAISSNTLFHYTKNLETLIQILDTGYFWPIYCIEYDKGKDDDGCFNAIPMVCFCDIPISLVREHMRDYGNFAIGISKQKIRDKVSPVIYYNDKDAISKRVLGKLSGRWQNLYFALIKRYCGETWSLGKNKLIRKILYNEREWRYIPRKIADSDFVLHVKPDSFKAKSESEKFRKHALYFNIDTLKWLIVDNDDNKQKLINYIHSNTSYTNIQKLYLISLIITEKQIKEDI